MKTTKITSKGQITLPMEVRDPSGYNPLIKWKLLRAHTGTLLEMTLSPLRLRNI